MPNGLVGGYTTDMAVKTKEPKKVLVDVAKIGRLGGLARVENLGPAGVSAWNRAAVNARWAKYYKEHPEKLKARQEREARRGSKRGRPPKAKRKAAKP